MEIAFRNLPFKPVEKQVIYIERNHDEQLNNFIRKNHEWIRKTFRAKGFEFCYLPILAKEAIRYNAPYITESSAGESESKIPRIADHITGKSIDSPSLVFALNIEVTDNKGNTILQAVAIEKKWYMPTKLVFRRLANLVNTTYLSQCNKYHEIEREKKRRLEWEKRQAEEARRRKEEQERRAEEARRRKEEPQRQDEELPKKTGCEGGGILFSKSKPKDRDTHEGTRFSIKHKNDRWEYLPDPYGRDVSSMDFDNILKEIETRKAIYEHLHPASKPNIPKADPDKADKYFEKESKALIDDIVDRIQALQIRGVNTMFLQDIIKPEQELSRLRITKDYRLFLIDYDNLEIKMTSLTKAVFLLFLRHPEGIRFKELSDYYKELLDIYLALSPRGSLQKQAQSIRDITDPTKNNINERCARIREAFIKEFCENLAENYCITGKRGEAKRIKLDSSLIVWE